MAGRKKTSRTASQGRTGGRKAPARSGKAAAGKRTASPRARKAPAKPRGQGGLGLHSVAPSFTVNDLDASLAFYRDVLGMVVTDRWEFEGRLMGVELRAGAATFMIGQDDWKKGRDRVKGEGFRVYCETGEDIDRLAERIKAKGGRLAQEPRDESWGARTLAVEDPDGFKITMARTKAGGR